MKILKQKTTLLAGLGVAIITGSALSPVIAFASGNSTPKNVTVGYDAKDDIVDPDSPDNPTFSVTIPKNIQFTNAKREFVADVVLNDIANDKFAQLANKYVSIDLKSKNGYVLTNDENAKIAYEMTYGGQKLDASTPGTMTKEIGQLTSTKTRLTGTAELIGLEDSKLGEYSGEYRDTLTYTVHAAQ